MCEIVASQHGVGVPVVAQCVPTGEGWLTTSTLDQVTEPVTVDCVIVSYNSAEDLSACLGSVADQFGVEVAVTVVDNCSVDDSVVVARVHGARVVVNTSNRGFAAAVNQGLGTGCSPWVLILNPDARLMPGGLHTMIEAVNQEDRVGCVGPKTTDVAGVTYPSARSFPGVFTAVIHGLLGSVWPGIPRRNVTTRATTSVTRHPTSTGYQVVACCCYAKPGTRSVASTNAISCTSRTWICVFGCAGPDGERCSSRRRRSCTSVVVRRGVAPCVRSTTTIAALSASTGAPHRRGTGQ